MQGTDRQVRFATTVARTATSGFESIAQAFAQATDPRAAAFAAAARSEIAGIGNLGDASKVIATYRDAVDLNWQADTLLPGADARYSKDARNWLIQHGRV